MIKLNEVNNELKKSLENGNKKRAKEISDKVDEEIMKELKNMSIKEFNCPHCKRSIDWSSEDWQDSFMDDSQSSEVLCKGCSKTFKIQPVLDISFEWPDDE